MAQWLGQYTGRTHESKVLDLEESVRKAAVAHEGAHETERAKAWKSFHHLCERLLDARLKMLRARLAILHEPGRKTSDQQLEKLQAHISEIERSGVDGIQNEFRIRK